MSVELLSPAAAAVAGLGEHALPCDLYDEHGGPIYHDITGADDSELREVLTLLRDITPAGAVLELAAGAGRMTLPILASGRAVTALDSSDTLLGILRGRLGELVPAAAARAHLVTADMADFRLPSRYAAIALGSTTITLLPPDRRPALYRCVRTHLQPDGCFIVTVPLPAESGAHLASVHRVATGLSGTRYDMYDEVQEGTAYRTVTVIPHQPPGSPARPVPVATSRPGLFDGRVVGDELRCAGFVLVHEITLGGLTERLDAGLQVWAVAR